MQTLIVKKKYRKTAPSRQDKKARLKKSVVEARNFGLIPSWLVKLIFEVVELREA